MDEIFVISRIIKIEVGVISRSRSRGLHYPWYYKKSNKIIVLLYIERNKKKWKSCFCFFIDGKQQKARELDMITLRDQAPCYHNMISRNFTVCFRHIRLTNRFHVVVRLSSNRSQMTSKCGKNKKVSLMFLLHFDVICDLLLNRRTATWNHSFYIIKK